MKGNILVVDDTPAVLKLLKDILVPEGHEVRPFNNGELALRSAAAEPPHLVLLDIRMPDMDGFEVCRRMKEDERLREIPVIFISAASDLEDKVRAFEAGGVDYITKPFQREEVVARVGTHVSLYRSREAMKRTEEALRKSEESLKMAQAIAHLGHWEWDLDSGDIRWSDETYRILGYVSPALAPTYDAFLQVVHPEDLARVDSEIRQSRESGRFDLEYRIVLPDGTVRGVRGIGQVVSLGAQGQPKIIATIQDITGHGRMELLGVIQDITERQELERRLEEEARTDALTGCANRRHFLELAEHEMARFRRYGGEMSLLMLDLDHFKAINDANGHHAGDLTLMELVRVCRATLREEDVVGRLGGEEFAVLLPQTGRDKAIEAAERLRHAVAKAEVPVPEGQPVHFTTSIGVATLTPADASIDMLLGRADQALYEAKGAGRNRVVAASAQPPIPG
ncbi:MAG: response regulator [Rhodocyclaceae bacterium]|nr:response regulator [Rhodocyclaceae bacterium]